MKTEPIGPHRGEIPPHRHTLLSFGYDIRYDPDQDLPFIVRTSDGAAVWGDQVGGRAILYEENTWQEIDLSFPTAFDEAFNEIHQRLDDQGFDCWDEALAGQAGDPS